MSFILTVLNAQLDTYGSIPESMNLNEFIFGETEADQFAAIMENVGLPPVELIEQSTRRKVYYGSY